MNELDPGPFAPLVGYVSAILATAFLLRKYWLGKSQAWHSPDEDLPGTIQKIFGVLCGIGIVGLWLYSNPNTLTSVFKLAIIFVILLIFSFIIYHFLIVSLTYKKEIVIGGSNITIIKIIGGLWLKKEAKDAKKKHCVSTTQELFEGSLYDEDKLWSRNSRGTAKILLIILYLGIMISGTLAISSAGFIVQVHLTKKPAASVITADEAPGIDKDAQNSLINPDIKTK